MVFEVTKPINEFRGTDLNVLDDVDKFFSGVVTTQLERTQGVV